METTFPHLRSWKCGEEIINSLANNLLEIGRGCHVSPALYAGMLKQIAGSFRSVGLFREPWRKLAPLKRVSGTELFAQCKKVSHLIGDIFDLPMFFRPVFFRLENGDNKKVFVGISSIVNVCKGTHHLLSVKASRNIGARIGSRKQDEVKGRPIRAVDARDSIARAAQVLAAVSALVEVPFQLGVPFRAGGYASVPQASAFPRGAEVRKTLVPAG